MIPLILQLHYRVGIVPSFESNCDVGYPVFAMHDSTICDSGVKTMCPGMLIYIDERMQSCQIRRACNSNEEDIRDDGLNDDGIEGADHDGCLCPQHLI